MKKIFENLKLEGTGQTYNDPMEPLVHVELNQEVTPISPMSNFLDEYWYGLKIFTIFRCRRNALAGARRVAFRNLNSYLFGDVVNELYEILQAVYGSEQELAINKLSNLIKRLEETPQQ